MRPRIALTVAMLLLCGVVHAAPKGKPQIVDNAAWERPQKPFRIFGNTYYVGRRGLSAILITSTHGDILIDATLAKNAPMIEANIRSLGFRLNTIKLILNSHAHADHAGAIAAMAHDSGASVAASAKGARALMLGGNDPDDPQYADASLYPAVDHVRVVADNEIIHIGSLAIQAHYTPGHTPGSTTWTWTSCEDKHCRSMVYADSLSPLTAGSYRYADPAHPERLEAFRRTLKTIAALPCDMLMVPHQDATDFLARAARGRSGQSADPLVDPNACKAYASTGQHELDRKIVSEADQAPAH
jgi:metallo-beta-lactamase class B